MSYREKKSRKKFIGGLLRMTCRLSVCGRPHPTDMKIARQRHKNQNFEKNGTYVKDNGVLRMPTNFLPIQPHLATGWPKNQKWPFLASNIETKFLGG